MNILIGIGAICLVFILIGIKESAKGGRQNSSGGRVIRSSIGTNNTSIPNVQIPETGTSQSMNYSTLNRKDKNPHYEVFEFTDQIGEPTHLGKRGDSFAQTGAEKMVQCGYCGADNIMPINPQKPYHCYFCWQKLGKK